MRVAATLTAAVALAGLPGSAGARLPSCRGSHWLAVWSASPSSATGELFVDQTLRLIVHPSYGWSRVRVGLSNRFGTAPVSFESASIARRRAGATLIRGSVPPSASAVT